MILLCGIPTESALARVAAELEGLAAPHRFFNQRLAVEGECCYGFGVEGIRGEVRLDGERLRLEDVSAAYTRMMDDRFLPELRGEPASSPRRVRCREVHAVLTDWMEITPARVVNRARAMSSNCAKPYQAQLMRSVGFAVPETLVTNQPALAREFLAEHGRVVYKSLSGIRSIVREIEASDLDRLDDIRWCPVQFQAHVPGVDVRVHVVGTEVIATKVDSDAPDYRYAGVRGGTPARLTATRLPDEVAERCVAVTALLGLRFSGIDLRLAAAGEVVCFEVNPCPAYTYYEGHTGQPIARVVARHLAGISS